MSRSRAWRLAAALGTSRAVMEAQTRAALASDPVAGEPGWLAEMRPLGAAWGTYLESLGIEGPASLFELGDAMADHYINVRGWLLLSPEQARDERAMLGRLTAQFPPTWPYATMVPVFSRDGDLLLLSPDGRVLQWLHDAFEDDPKVVAATLDALIETWLDVLER